MDALSLIEELIKKTPHSIGATAGNYAKAFKSILIDGTENVNEFKKAFFIVLIQRDAISNTKSKVYSDLFFPIYKKDEDVIFKLYDLLGVGKEEKYRVDLSSAILYSILMESEFTRELIQKTDDIFHKIFLKVIYKEVKSIHSVQVKTDEIEFCNYHLPFLNTFLGKYSTGTAAGRQQAAIARFFGGGKVALKKEVESLKTSVKVYDAQSDLKKKITEFTRKLDIQTDTLRKVNQKSYEEFDIQGFRDMIKIDIERLIDHRKLISSLSSDEELEAYLKKWKIYY